VAHLDILDELLGEQTGECDGQTVALGRRAELGQTLVELLDREPGRHQRYAGKNDDAVRVTLMKKVAERDRPESEHDGCEVQSGSPMLADDRGRHRGPADEERPEHL